MIFDKIENINLYAGINAHFKDAIAWLQDTDLTNISKGKHVINGEELFALVNQYHTKEESQCIAESHKKYIDLQYMFHGSEKIAFSMLFNQKATNEYNPVTDALFYIPENMNYLILQENCFAVFFPVDIHMPSIMIHNSLPVKKIVIKIRTTEHEY
jgi:biofilm protein TabA